MPRDGSLRSAAILAAGCAGILPAGLEAGAPWHHRWMVDPKVIRWQSAIAHTGVILWQVYSAATAWRSGLVLEKLLKGLGAEYGAGVRIFIVTSRWWWIVPVVFAVLSVAAIRRIETRPRFAISVLAAEVIAALVMNIWWRESYFGPLFDLIRQVG